MVIGNIDDKEEMFRMGHSSVGEHWPDALVDLYGMDYWEMKTLNPVNPSLHKVSIINFRILEVPIAQKLIQSCINVNQKLKLC